MWSWLAIIPASIIVYQDFKSREISWWTLPFLFVFLVISKLNLFFLSELLILVSVNCGVITIQFMFVSLYFSLKKRKPTNIFNTYIGVGDLLFLFAVSPLFEPLYFVLFEIISLTAVLVGTLLFGFIKKGWSFKIPLAGFQSILLIIYLVTTGLKTY